MVGVDADTGRGECRSLADSIRSRRSVRRYEPRPVPREVIDGLLDCARWAPSAHNRQPWRFAVVQSAEIQDRLARSMGTRLRADLERDSAASDAIEADVARSYARITGAPVVMPPVARTQHPGQFPIVQWAGIQAIRAERTASKQSQD